MYKGDHTLHNILQNHYSIIRRTIMIELAILNTLRQRSIVNGRKETTTKEQHIISKRMKVNTIKSIMNNISNLRIKVR